jgi:ABC-type dipeptide/oligopeptide/nickel transport system permease subunit
VVVLLAFPVLFLMSMALVAALLGETLRRSREKAYEGSELVDLNR